MIFYPDSNLDNDISSSSQLAHSAIQLTAYHRFFGGQFSVDMIAVHPSYWRHGHGTSLLGWATVLADADQIVLGIASVRMGIHIAERVGFEEKEVIDVKGYSDHPKGFQAWIGVRQLRLSWSAWLLDSIRSILGS